MVHVLHSNERLNQVSCILWASCFQSRAETLKEEKTKDLASTLYFNNITRKSTNFQMSKSQVAYSVFWKCYFIPIFLILNWRTYSLFDVISTYKHPPIHKLGIFQKIVLINWILNSQPFPQRQVLEWCLIPILTIKNAFLSIVWLNHYTIENVKSYLM